MANTTKGKIRKILKKKKEGEITAEEACEQIAAVLGPPVGGGNPGGGNP